MVWLKDARHGGRKAMAFHFHPVPINGIVPRHFQCDAAIIDQLQQMLVETVHAFMEGGFDVAGEHVQIVPRDGILGARAALHDLQARDSAVRSAGDEPLAQDGVQTPRQECAGIGLLGRGVEFPDAIDGLADRIRVQGG